MSVYDDENSYNGNLEKKTSNPVFFKSNRKIVLGDTGIKTQHYVGSIDEDLYFKVRIVSEIIGNEGITLFYDNPRDYCVHRLTVLEKKNFKNKNNNSLFNNKINKMMSSLSSVIDVWNDKRNHYLFLYN